MKNKTLITTLIVIVGTAIGAYKVLAVGDISATQPDESVNKYIAACEASATAEKAYVYKEGKLIRTYTTALPADCFGEHCKGEANVTLAMQFTHGSEELPTALVGPSSIMQEYQKTLKPGEIYGLCVHPYLYNQQTHWRLQQDLKIVSIGE